MLNVNPPTQFGKKKYILILIDDYSRYSQIFLMNLKSETPKFLNSGLQFLQSILPGPGQFSKLRCDNGTEFISAESQTVLNKFGLELQLAEPYQHKHNGTAERFNRTLQEKARALIFYSGFPITYIIAHLIVLLIS